MIRSNPKVVETLKTPDDFVLYLNSLHPDESVGISGDACECPLARFLGQEFLEAGEFEVTSHYIGTPWSLDLVECPPWVGDFLYQVDRYCGEIITAAEALEMLT